MSIDWATIEPAINAFLVGTSGLAASNVFWGQQGAPRVSPPYIVFTLISLDEMGDDSRYISDNPTPSAGAEILYNVAGWRKAILTIEITGVTPLGANSPKAIMDTLKTRAKLPSLRDALVAARVGLGVFAPTTLLPSVVGAVTEPRALSSATLFVVSETSETGTYVETAQGDGTGELAGVSFNTGA